MKRKICGWLALGCAIWIFCLAGASDCGTINCGEILLQGTAAISLMYLNLKLGGFFK